MIDLDSIDFDTILNSGSLESPWLTDGRSLAGMRSPWAPSPFLRPNSGVPGLLSSSQEHTSLSSVSARGPGLAAAAIAAKAAASSSRMAFEKPMAPPVPLQTAPAGPSSAPLPAVEATRSHPPRLRLSRRQLPRRTRRQHPGRLRRPPRRAGGDHRAGGSHARVGRRGSTRDDSGTGLEDEHSALRA